MQNRTFLVRGLSVLGALSLLVSPQLAIAHGGGGGGGHDDDDDDDGCEQIQGRFGAMSVPVPPCTSPVGLCTMGTLKGGLRGTYELEVATNAPTGNPDTPTVFFFTGTSVVSLNNGEVWTGTDSGALNLAPPGIIGSGSFSTLLTFTDGVEGWLHIRGVLDLTTGQVSGNYNGTVCQADD